VAVFDVEAAREASVPVRETLDWGWHITELRPRHGGERSRTPSTVGGSEETVGPVEACSFRASHCRKWRTSLTSAAASSAAPALAAVSAASVVRLRTPAPESIRSPSIPLVLWCVVPLAETAAAWGRQHDALDGPVLPEVGRRREPQFAFATPTGFARLG
jgi:hypothetical protein